MSAARRKTQASAEPSLSVQLVKSIDCEIASAIPPSIPPAARMNVVAALQAHIERRLCAEASSQVDGLAQAVCFSLSASSARQKAGQQWLEANPAQAKRARYVFDRHPGLAKLKSLIDGVADGVADNIPVPGALAPAPGGAAIPQGALQLIFAQVGIHGDFPPALVEIVRRLRKPRTFIYLAFPPKCGGTFIREVVGRVAGAGLFRPAHALGGRDVVPYLPTLAQLLLGPAGPARIMTHAHLMGHYANVQMLNLFDIKPVIMRRSIPDMLCSFFDMADKEGLDAEGRYNWSLLCGVHTDPSFLSMTASARRDFLVYHQAPWYFQFYASWLRAHREQRIPTHWVDYDGFRADPQATVSSILDYYGIPYTSADVAAHLAAAKSRLASLRFNRGASGRGADLLTPAHFDHLARLADGYPDIDFVGLGLLPSRKQEG